MNRAGPVWLVLAAIALSAGCDAGSGGSGAGAGDGGAVVSAFTSPHFAGAQRCAVCHDGITDGQGTDLSMVRSWSASMMANSAADPFYQAKVASEAHRAPGLAGEIEQTCSRCHAPMAHVEAIFDRQTPKLFGNGFLNPDNPYHASAREGVSCTLCHQIADTQDLGEAAGFDGGFTIPDAFGLNRRLAGSLESPVVRPMQEQVAFTPAYASHMGRSELCATCHNLQTEVVDGRQQLTGDHFQEQAIYSEWEHSRFGRERSKECQDCHMPAHDGVKVATRPRWLEARDGVASHRFSGGNTVMLNILAQNKTALGALGDDFAGAIAANRALLASAARLAVQSPNLAAGTLEFSVQVENRSGHKLPSGYPARRLVLHVVVTDASGQVVFESGKMENGRLSEGDADRDATTFEPHHAAITSPEQVQIYEAVMENTDGELTYTLLRAAGYAKDNRLLPAGFEKSQVPKEIAVVGAAHSDSDFVGGADEVTYRIGNLGSGPYEIKAELIYQPLGYRHVQDLFTDRADVAQVERFARLYEKTDLLTETIASVQLEIGE